MLAKFVNTKTKSVIESLVVFMLYYVKIFKIFTKSSLFSFNQLINIEEHNKFTT